MYRKNIYVNSNKGDLNREMYYFHARLGVLSTDKIHPVHFPISKKSMDFLKRWQTFHLRNFPLTLTMLMTVY